MSEYPISIPIFLLQAIDHQIGRFLGILDKSGMKSLLDSNQPKKVVCSSSLRIWPLDLSKAEIN